MTRLELYHKKTKRIYRKGLLLFLLLCILLAGGLLALDNYYKSTIRIDSPNEHLGKKVVVQMPNGQEVFTYEKLIFKREGKTYYKGERNTIDLTGGTIVYKNWK